MVRRHLRVGRHFRSLSDDSDHATRSVRVDKKLGWRSSPRALSMIRKTMLETVPARASSPGCSARMIKFASPPSEVMLEAPGVRREPLFEGGHALSVQTIPYALEWRPPASPLSPPFAVDRWQHPALALP